MIEPPRCLAAATKSKSEIGCRRSNSLIWMVRDPKSDVKGSEEEGGLGWREGFVLSGSMCFEKIIIFLIMSECYRTKLI